MKIEKFKSHSTGPKTVRYGNLTINVPEWVNFIASDEQNAGGDSMITGFENEPMIYKKSWLHNTDNEKFVFIGYGILDTNWKESLVEV